MLLTYDRMGGLKVVLWVIAVAVCIFLLVPIIFIIALSFGSSKWLAFPPPAWTLRWTRFGRRPGATPSARRPGSGISFPKPWSSARNFRKA